LVEVAQTAQLLIWQLGTHWVWSELVMKRSKQVSQVVLLAHLLQ
jgi:hypothetical protein